jgi:hypothetical protein
MLRRNQTSATVRIACWPWEGEWIICVIDAEFFGWDIRVPDNIRGDLR